MNRFNAEAYDKGLVASGAGCMPALGFGTWQIKGQQCTDSVKEALRTGYRLIDTAQGYNNEEYVGAALDGSDVRREDIFLTTKIWREALCAGDVKRKCDESLMKLKTEYIDLFLIHWPNEEIPIEETLGAMGELAEEGKICYAGVSNFTVKLLREAVERSPVPVFSNQVEYHPYLSQAPVIDFCRSHDIILTAYSPLARGKVLGEDAFREIGVKYGKSAAQVVLRWLIQQEGVVAIPKASSVEHVRSNFEIFDFELDEDDMRLISGFTRQCERIIDPVEYFPVPKWDT